MIVSGALRECIDEISHERLSIESCAPDMSFVIRLTWKAARSAILLLACLLVVNVFATEPSTLSSRTDIRLIIDISGSMKRNDPENLRRPAVDLLVRMLPEGSYAGIWTFGRQVNMLVPFNKVDDQWRELARLEAGNINTTGLFTNIGAALESAGKLPSPLETGHGHIILMTDGMVDIDRDPVKNLEERKRILNELLPNLKDKGLTIHTIALSENADAELMKKLALATDGVHSVADNADELMLAFLNAFDASAPVDQLPIGQSNTFLVDSSVEELTALVFRRQPDQATQLVSPDGAIYLADRQVEDVHWYRTNQYDLMTIRAPLEGEWKILADIAPESRVTVVSNLGLRLRPLPTNILEGAVLTAEFALTEENTPVTDPAFLALLSAKVVVNRRADGVADVPVWTTALPAGEVPERGIFSISLPALREAGDYRLDLEVKGPTFQRRISHPLQVTPPFSLEHKAMTNVNGLPGFQVRVIAHTSDLVPEKTQVVASIVGPDRRKLIRPLQWDPQRFWVAEIATYSSGDHILAAKVTGESASGVAFQYDLGPVVLGLDLHAMFDTPSADEVVAEQPPAPEPVKVEPPAEVSETESVPAEPDGGGIPTWLWIAVFIIGNIVVLGVSYPYLRRRIRAFRNQDPLAEYSESLIREERGAKPESVATDLEREPEPELDEFDMEDAAAMEDEPQMEDLKAEYEMQPEPEPMVMDTPKAQEVPIDVPEIPPDDDYGVDDIENDIVDWATGAASEEEKEDFAAQMLKAQGLDLDEDELDDAISHLIEELDGDADEPNDHATVEPEAEDIDPLTGFKRR